MSEKDRRNFEELGDLMELLEACESRSLTRAPNIAVPKSLPTSLIKLIMPTLSELSLPVAPRSSSSSRICTVMITTTFLC